MWVYCKELGGLKEGDVGAKEKVFFRVRGLDLGVFMGKAVEEKENCDEPIILPGQIFFQNLRLNSGWGGRADVLRAGRTGTTCHRAALEGVG